MGQMEVGAATSCKTEKGPMTGYVKEPRREIGHKDGFDGSKIIESFKGGNKFGLSEATDKEMNALNEERNGVPKDTGLGWVATHEKILVNTKHLKDIMENKKKFDVNISKESLKEENKKVTKYKFKESEKESLLGNMRHKKSAKISGKGFHASGADHNIGHVNIKKETSMVHCTEGTNQAGRGQFDRGLSRVIESQKKRDIAGEKNQKN